MRRFSLLVLLLVTCAAFIPTDDVLAACRRSLIMEFELTTPDGKTPGAVEEGDLLRYGYVLDVHARANCGKMRIYVNGDVQIEMGQPEISTSIKTDDFEIGMLTVEVRVRDDSDSSWRSAVRRTITIETGFVPERLNYGDDPAAEAATADEGFSFPPGCSPLAQLKIGDRARVSDETPDPLPLRRKGDAEAAVLDQIPVNTVLVIEAGPVCRGRFVWWQVTFKGQPGWVAETNYYNNYNLLPADE